MAHFSAGKVVCRSFSNRISIKTPPDIITPVGHATITPIKAEEPYHMAMSF
jgi:hypothetical protein